MNDRTHEHTRDDQSYEAPEVVEIGRVEEVTLGGFGYGGVDLYAGRMSSEEEESTYEIPEVVEIAKVEEITRGGSSESADLFAGRQPVATGLEE